MYICYVLGYSHESHILMINYGLFVIEYEITIPIVDTWQNIINSYCSHTHNFIMCTQHTLVKFQDKTIYML